MEFREKLHTYLSTPVESRNIMEGALLLLQIDGNKTFYKNIEKKEDKYAPKLFYLLEKYAKLYEIKIDKKVPSFDAEKSLILGEEGEKRIAKGKRADHDKLPPEIQQLWVDIAELRNKSRSYHERSKAAEKDCDRHEAITLLIEADTKVRENWAKYDAYVVGSEVKKEDNTIEDKSLAEGPMMKLDAKRINSNRAYLSRNKEKLKELKDSQDEAEYAKYLMKMQERYDELESSGNPVSDKQKEELRSLGLSL